jgi:hypothetical protein
MSLKSLLLGSIAALSLTAPALAATKIWVHNESGYLISDVFADYDTSGGTRDLLGPKGKVFPYDKTLTLNIHIEGCYTDIAAVTRQGAWAWVNDVYLCDGVAHVYFYDDNF